MSYPSTLVYDGDFDLVPMGDKVTNVAQFGLEVMRANSWLHFDLFDFDLFLLFPCLPCLALLFIENLLEVYDLTHRWRSLRGHLYEI